MLGHGHGGERRLAAQQRRRIRGGDHHHGARQTGLAQIVLEELPHLASPLADQGEHRDIAGGVARQHGEQARLADAGAGEQAEPLPLAARREAIERADADIQPRTQPRPVASPRAGLRARGGDEGRTAAARGRPAAGPTDPARGQASRSTPAAFRRSARRPMRAGTGRHCLDPARRARRTASPVPDRGGSRRSPQVFRARRAPPAAARSPMETCPLSPSISTTRPDNPATRPSTL